MLKTFRLSTPLGHSMRPPTPPNFGQPRFTKQQQSANPDKPMTRVVKDVLRLGKWKIGVDDFGKPIFWDVTPQVLATLSASSSDRIRRGDAINFGKSHGDEDLIIPTDDLISPIDSVKVANGVLWVSSYVTPATAAYLANPARKVSVGVKTMGDYIAGDGSQYPLALAHVAVTDRPAVTAQGPFLTLTNSTVPKGSKVLDVPKLIEALNKLLAAFGMEPLPPDVDEKNLIEVLKAKASGSNASVDDVAMCNRIAKRTGKKFSDVWATMPKFNASYSLSNAALQPAARPAITTINQILKTPSQPTLPLNTTDENLDEKLIELYGQIKEGLKFRADTSPASAAMANRHQRRATNGLLSDDEMAARLAARGVDPKSMPRFDC